MKKRITFLTLTLCLLLTACAATSNTPLPTDAPVDTASEPTASYDEQCQYDADGLEGIEPQEDDFAEDITDSPEESQMQMIDRINLIYEWLDLTCQEQRWTEDLTYDVRRPWEELTDEERAAQGQFRFISSSFSEWTPENMVARGYVQMCCNREVTCPVFGNTPNPSFIHTGSGDQPTTHWVFANWYAAFLHAGGYEAGFETLWDEDVRDAFLEALRPS